MRVNKLIRIGLTILAGVVIVTGCAENKTLNSVNQSSKQLDEKPKEIVKLKFWGGVPEDAGPQQVTDAWNAAHPDIQVEYVRYVNDDNGNLKVDTTLMTGNEIDIYLSHNLFRVKKRADIGGAVDLSQFNDYDIEGKLGEEVADWKIDDKYYALPTVQIKYAILLNKKALDDAGLEVPYDWDLKDLEEYARKLKTDNRWGFVHDVTTPLMAWVDGALKLNGYYKNDGTSNLDDPLARQGFENLNRMMNEDKTALPYGQQVASKLAIEQLFMKGEAAMYNTGTYQMRNTSNLETNPRDFKVAFAPTPKPVGVENYSRPTGLNDGISINPKSKHVEEAWEFVKWYMDGGLMPMVKGGRIPQSNAVAKDDIVKTLTEGVEDYYDLDSLEKVILDHLPTFTIPLTQKEIDIRKEEYEFYFTEAKSIDEMLSSMTKRHNEFIKQNK